MQIKKFDQALHDKYDPPARAAVTKWVQAAWNMQAKDNPDQYGVDLIAYRDGIQVGFIEVEVRNWSPCPFNTIHVPVRKKHMLEVPNTLFFALTKDLGHAYWITGDKPLIYKTVEMKDNTKHEAYYDVPKSLFNYVKL
jgi:hypothetical protein